MGSDNEALDLSSLNYMLDLLNVINKLLIFIKKRVLKNLKTENLSQMDDNMNK